MSKTRVVIQGMGLAFALTRVEQMRRELNDWTDASGLSPSVLLQLSEPLRSTLKRIMKEGSITFAELAVDLGLPMADTEVIADQLVACGFLKTTEHRPSGEIVYLIRHLKTHRPEAPAAIWGRLFDLEGESGDAES